MEANEKVIEKHVYEEGNHDWDRTERKARNGFGMGLAGVITGGLALLNQYNGGRGLFGLGGSGMPENININTKINSTHDGIAAFFMNEFFDSRSIGVKNLMQSVKNRIGISFIWMFA